MEHSSIHRVCGSIATKSGNTTNMHLHLKHNQQMQSQIHAKPAFQQMLQTFDSQYKLPNGNSTTVQRERRHTKGSGLLFLFVCNSSAIFANRDWESFLFIVSGCFVYLFWIFKMSSSHSNSNVKYSLEIKVYWSLKGCTCIAMSLPLY